MDPGPQGGWAVDQMSERLSNLDMRLPNCLVRTGVLALFHRPPIHAESLQNLRVFRTKTYCNTTQMCAFGRETNPANLAKADDPPSGREFGHRIPWRQEFLMEKWATRRGPFTHKAASNSLFFYTCALDGETDNVFFVQLLLRQTAEFRLSGTLPIRRKTRPWKKRPNWCLQPHPDRISPIYYLY